MSARKRRPARSRAEWITFAASCVVLGVIVLLVAAQMLAEPMPVSLQARRNGPVRTQDGQYFVPVEVRNTGDDAATEVQVIATLTTAGAAVDSDQVIDFMAGDETEQLEFVFPSDPAAGELEVRIGGFAVP